MTREPEEKDDKLEDRPASGKTVATPEGDNEFAPDQPLKPIDEGPSEATRHRHEQALGRSRKPSCPLLDSER